VLKDKFYLGIGEQATSPKSARTRRFCDRAARAAATDPCGGRRPAAVGDSVKIQPVRSSSEFTTPSIQIHIGPLNLATTDQIRMDEKPGSLPRLTHRFAKIALTVFKPSSRLLRRESTLQGTRPPTLQVEAPSPAGRAMHPFSGLAAIGSLTFQFRPLMDTIGSSPSRHGSLTLKAKPSPCKGGRPSVARAALG
jgi:hypothetical protein